MPIYISFKAGKMSIKFGIVTLVVLLLFYSCNIKVSRWYMLKDEEQKVNIILSFDGDSIFKYSAYSYGYLYQYSSGSYLRKGNTLILKSNQKSLCDTVRIESSKIPENNYILINFRYLRIKKDAPSSLQIRYSNSMVDTSFFALFSPLILFDNNSDSSILHENLIGGNAFRIESTKQKAIITLRAVNNDFTHGGKGDKFSFSLDSSANVFNIWLYSKQYDSLDNYRFLDNEVWQLKGKRILDTKTNDEFVKTKKLPYRFREHDYTNPDVPDLLNYPEFNVRDSLGRKQGVWKTVPDSLPNFRYNTLRFKDVVDKRKYLANNDSTTGSITLYETYIDDKLVGPFKGLYSNSSIAFRGEYRNNRVDGKYFEYSSNGEISFFANYNMGMLQGKCVEFGFFGVMEAEYTYENGILREEIIYECFGSKRDGFHNSVDEFLIPYINYIIKYDKKGRPYNGRVYAYDYQGKIERVFEYRKHKLYKEYSVIYDWEENCYEFVNEDRDYPWWWKH